MPDNTCPRTNFHTNVLDNGYNSSANAEPVLRKNASSLDTQSMCYRAGSLVPGTELRTVQNNDIFTYSWLLKYLIQVDRRTRSFRLRFCVEHTKSVLLRRLP